MISGIFRVIAVLIGAVLVLGGGLCTLVGVPTGLIALFNGGAAGVGMLFATAVGFVVLLIGLRLLKFGGGSTPPAAAKSEASFNDYLGKYFLISVNHVGQDNESINTIQMHGHAVELNAGSVRIALTGKCEGQSWTVPLASIRPAQAGTFTIQATGEEVKDPDYFAYMTAKRAPTTVPAAL